MRRTWMVLAVAAVLAAACTGGSSGEPPASASDGSTGGNGSAGGVEGGVLKIGTSNQLDSLNPFVAFSAASYQAFIYDYPYLLGIGPSTDFVPDFATKWQSSADGKTWTFTTTAGAKWSDGQPLTADDAAWTISTIKRFQAGPTALFSGNVAHLASAVATDPTTLTLTYEAPVANVLAQLAQVPILPRHVWERYAGGSGKGLKTFGNPAPWVSGGPFQLVKFDKGQDVLFKANPTWYGQKPHIDGWGLTFYSNDDAMLQALRNGQIDAITNVPDTESDALQKDGFVLESTPADGFYELMFNSNPNKPEHRELLDPEVRAALEHAVDRQRIIDVAYLGHGTLGASVVPPSTGKWNDPSIKPLPFDIGEANQMLDTLGFARGADGIRVADGHPMSYQVVFPTGALSGFGDRLFQIIQNDFQQVGVRVAPQKLDDSAAFDAIGAPTDADGNYTYGSYDMAIWDWYPYYDPDYILSVFTCAQYGNLSDSAYCNKEYDRMYSEQSVTLEPQARLDLVYRMQQMLNRDKPYIVLAYPDIVEAHSKDWTGFVETPGQGSISETVSKVALVQVQRAG
jgi:peptide/nickel transport system substrate-binding protein